MQGVPHCYFSQPHARLWLPEFNFKKLKGETEIDFASIRDVHVTTLKKIDIKKKCEKKRGNYTYGLIMRT